jgi:predicted acyl esterase
MKTKEIMIQMHDGVRLQSYISFPVGEGPFPALLVRCMYGTDLLENEAESWTEKGYAVLLQNVRGRHGSEGGPTGRHDFPEDGYDTREWMTA